MKLTEQQLAEIFQTNTRTNQTEATCGDCLGAIPASATRLSHAEEILNDFNSAQGAKMAFAYKQWSAVVADSIKQSQQSWFSLLGRKSPFKTAVATAAFAVAFVVAMPEFRQNHETMIPVQNNYANDVILGVPFEGQSDVLSNGSFDGGDKAQDELFGGNFG
ncbi:MAG: hypothetical protein R3E90_16380 [Marinicella sp.]|nr:hypothetical protein [Xanthomonadales bacterium]